MTGLTTLFLDNTQVSDLGPLSGMTGLTSLTLDNIQISDLAPLSDKRDLRLLYLTNTPVLDLRPLRAALADASHKGFELRIAGTSAKAVVTFWTADSVTSKPVIEEAATAQGAGRLVHVRLDDAELPYGFGETQYIDLRRWDGTAQHPQMARLLMALRDRLNPPDAAALSDRLAAASDVGMQPVHGRLQPFDTPLGVRPEVENEPDLEARLDGLKQTLQGLREMVASGQFQFQLDLGFALSSVHRALHAGRLSWYGIDDARAVLADCMAEHDAKGSWNSGAYTRATRLVTGMTALQPLLQPLQVPIGEPGAKPPAPDPVVRAADLPQVQDIAKDVAAAAASPEADSVLAPDASDLLQRDVALIKAGAQIADADRRAPKLRRAVRGLIFTTGAIIAALSTETVASLLTSPEAAATLLIRLQQVRDMLLRFFL